MISNLDLDEISFSNYKDCSIYVAFVVKLHLPYLHWEIYGNVLNCLILLFFLQVGVINFEPYSKWFMSSYSHSRTSYPTFPNLPSLFSYPSRNWRTCQPKEQLPALGLKLQQLMDKLKVRLLIWLLQSWL